MCNHKFFHKYYDSFINEMVILVTYKVSKAAKLNNDTFINEFEHKIELMVDDQLIKQRQYKMNPNYALKVRQDIDKLLDARFIYPIKTS